MIPIETEGPLPHSSVKVRRKSTDHQKIQMYVQKKMDNLPELIDRSREKNPGRKWLKIKCDSGDIINEKDDVGITSFSEKLKAEGYNTRIGYTEIKEGMMVKGRNYHVEICDPEIESRSCCTIF